MGNLSKRESSGFKTTAGCRRQPELLAHLAAIFFYPRTKILKNYDRPTEVKVTVRSG